MTKIDKLLDTIGISFEENRGRDVIRAQTEITSEVFLLILAVSLVGGLAVSLGDVTQGILPGPEGNVGMTQNGDEMVLTVDNLDNNVGQLEVQIANNGTSGGATYGFTEDNSSHSGMISDVNEDEPSAGQTMVFSVSEGAIITVVAKADDSDRQSRIATREVGPTG